LSQQANSLEDVGQQPLVSILIPVYNAERWVRQSIESALAQTYPRKEIIVVDDGSTDGTPALIHSFGEKIRFCRSVHSGGNVARNLLLEMSNGEWLQYLDADDYLLPGKIAGQVAELKASGDSADIICSPYMLRNEADGDEVPMMFDSPFDPAAEYIRWGRFWTGAFLMRRSSLREVGGWKEDQIACQEHELLLRLIRAGKRFGFHNSLSSVYRQHSNATVSKRDPLLTTRLRMKLTDEFELFLKEKQRLGPLYSKLLFTARMESARSTWLHDSGYALELSRKASAGESHWVRNSPALPFHFQVAHFLFGFRKAQQIASFWRDGHLMC
jgi:glycosyltransferase involved in cell wall biosynthesis